jgi:hypothetical protein
MLTRIKHLLPPPVFEDAEKTRVANLLNIIIWVLIIAIIIRAIWSLFLPAEEAYSLIIYGVVLAILVGGLALMRVGRVREVSFILTGLLWGVIVLSMFSFGGIRGGVYEALVVIVLVVGLLLGGRWASGVLTDITAQKQAEVERERL